VKRVVVMGLGYVEVERTITRKRAGGNDYELSEKESFYLSILNPMTMRNWGKQMSGQIED
jgi:hypothetical protein